MAKQHLIDKKNTGFTIREIMTVLLITVLVAEVALILFKKTISLNEVLLKNLNAQSEIRNSFKTIASEIRSASPSSAGAYPMVEVSTSSLIFFSEIDHDNLKERIRYFLSANILKKGVIKPSGNPLVYNVANEKITDLIHNIAISTSTPIFNYFDATYDGTSAPLANPVNILSVRLIKISIIIDHDPLNPPAPQYFSTQVSMRNLKDNL
jgi:hypothetical protein